MSDVKSNVAAGRVDALPVWSQNRSVPVQFESSSVHPNLCDRRPNRLGMSTKAKLVLVLAFVVLIYFLVGNDAEPVEVTLENESEE